MQLVREEVQLSYLHLNNLNSESFVFSGGKKVILAWLYLDMTVSPVFIRGNYRGLSKYLACQPMIHLGPFFEEGGGSW